MARAQMENLQLSPWWTAIFSAACAFACITLSSDNIPARLLSIGYLIPVFFYSSFCAWIATGIHLFLRDCLHWKGVAIFSVAAGIPVGLVSAEKVVSLITEALPALMLKYLL